MKLYLQYQNNDMVENPHKKALRSFSMKPYEVKTTEADTFGARLLTKNH